MIRTTAARLVQHSALLSAALALVGGAVVAGVVTSSSGGPGASGWHVGYYNPSGRALSEAEAAPVAGGVAALNFTGQPNTALLITDQGSNKAGLLGNDSGGTITATFTVTGVTGAFTYSGEPDGSGAGATVRLYFETKGGPFAYTNFWWSDTAFQDLTANGTFTLTAKLDPTTAAWSDWNGQPSGANTTAFENAASDVTGIGLSFGGGYFFENGVGTTDGSGSLQLTSFTVS
jgi:hypothetical protein